MLCDGVCVVYGLVDGEVVWMLFLVRVFIEVFFELVLGYFILKIWVWLFCVDGEDGVIVWECEYGMESCGQIVMVDGMVCLYIFVMFGLFGFEFLIGDVVELE